jgi:YD repeat-containing protein
MKYFIRPLCAMLCVAAGSGAGYAQKASQAPAQQTFTLSPDKLRALQNSVNLFTGQVSFPMELASLAGRGGLDMTVSIQYNSDGTDKMMPQENSHSPTGILGLGWSMEIPRITADNKQTGTRHDDDFFYIENGSANALLCKSYTLDGGKFATKKFTAWKIDYFPAEEKWVIIKENGLKYTFQPVQWMVKWGNWIGNSAQTQNQGRSAYVWALTEVENTWGEKLLFQYDLVEEPVGTGGLSHTKAFYLSKITDPTGQSITFNYVAKDPYEYQDLHQERVEPDAYQEKFETRYLSNLVARSAQNTVLYTVALGYDKQGEFWLTKRILKTIQKQYPSGETQPATEFEYFDSGDLKGYLKKVFNSIGAHIDYFYENTRLDNSAPVMSAGAPAGYGQAKSYVAGDYVVVTWRKVKSDGTVDGGAQPVKVHAFYWNGEWNSLPSATDLFEIPAVTDDDYQQAEISMSSRHFVYRLYSLQNNTFYVHAARIRDYSVGPNVWAKYSKTYRRDGTSPPNEIGHVVAGEDFVAFNIRWLNTIDVFTWRDESWVNETLWINDPEFENFLTASGNFIFLHNDNKGGRDMLHLFYLNAEKEWKESRVPSDLAFTTEGDKARDSHWHACNSFVFGLPQYNPEYTYLWDENYSNFQKTNMIGQYDDGSLISMSSEGLMGLVQWNHNDGVALRYDGVNWHKQTYPYNRFQETGFGTDYLVRSQNFVDKSSCFINFFNPNTLQWDFTTYGTLVDFDRINDQNGSAVQAGLDLFMRNQWLIKRRVDGGWSWGENIPLGTAEYLIGSSAIVMAPNYIAYEYSTTKSGKAAGTYIVRLENNNIKEYERVVGYGIDPGKSNAGPSTLVLKSLSRTGEGVILYRIMPQKFSMGQMTPIVRSTLWSDGNHLFKTFIDYDNGRMGPSGTPQFNDVATFLGEHSGEPAGFTQQYFYNGLTVGELREHHITDAPPLGEENLVLGLPYCTVVKNSSGNEVSRTTTHYTGRNIFIKNPAEHAVGIAHALYTSKTDKLTDNMFTTVASEYDPTTGLVTKTTASDAGSANYSEITTTFFTYWWQVYDATQSLNLLTPVVQTRSVRQRTGAVGAGTYTVTEATKWLSTGPRSTYYPAASYSWKHTGSSEFTAWGSNDVPSADWILTSKVSKINASDGIITESESNDGSRVTFLYDGSHTRLLAKASFAATDQVAYTSFEDNDLGGWSRNGGVIGTTESFIGSKSLATNGTDVLLGMPLKEGTYEVSWWSKGPAAPAEVAGGSIQQITSDDVQRGWTLRRAVLHIDASGGSVRVKIPAAGYVDEVRLKPQGADMRTYSYNVEGHMTSETETNLFSTYYEYDTQYRLVAIKDHKGRVVKKYTYHFRNQ